MKIASTYFSKNASIASLSILFTLLLILMSTQNVYCAELSGTVYNKNLEPAKFSLLTINTTPAQRIILENGTYSINLNPGTYIVQATYHDGKTKYEDNATLKITNEGKYTYDFITFNTAPLVEQEIPSIDDVVIKDQTNSPSTTFIYITIVILCIIILGFVIFVFVDKKKRKNENKNIHDIKNKEDDSNKTTKEMSADLSSILAILKEEGGRTTQKELRKHIPCSEAKISMMLTELEHKGKIERIKKGRTNLIILK